MVDEVYKINGLTFCPTQSRWLPRRPLAVQGDGRPLYAPVRSYQLEWEFHSYSEWANVQAQFDKIASTGTAVVQIPAFPTATGQSYAFMEYSGVLLGEPEVGAFFEGFPSSIVLVISNIITGSN